MAQKNATPTKAQSQVITAKGLKAWEWTVMQDLQHSMIVRNRFTGEVKHNKKGHETIKYIKPTPLSREGSFENIVNAKTAQRRKEKFTTTARWLNRTFLTMVILVSVLLLNLLLNLLLWRLSVVPTGPSSLVSKVITCVVSFLAGRIWEVLKR